MDVFWYLVIGIGVFIVLLLLVIGAVSIINYKKSTHKNFGGTEE